MMLVFTAIVIPYISLPGVLTADPQERLSANGYRLFFAKGASLLVNTFVPVFAARWGQEHLARGYQVSMAVMAGLATLLFIFCFFMTTERVVHSNDRKPLWQQIVLLGNNDQWMILAGVCVIGTIGYVIRGSVGLYYAKYFLGGGAEHASRLHHHGHHRQHPLHDRFHVDHEEILQNQLFRWSQLITFALSLIMYVAVKPGGIAAAFVLYFLINFIVDLQGPVFWSIISEAVDYGQIKSGKRVAELAFAASPRAEDRHEPCRRNRGLDVDLLQIHARRGAKRLYVERHRAAAHGHSLASSTSSWGF